MGQDVRGRRAGPAPDHLLQLRCPDPVEGLGQDPHPVRVGDGRRLRPVRGVHLEPADTQGDRQVGAAAVGECAQAHAALAEGVVGGVEGPRGRLGARRGPRLGADPGALPADPYRPVGAGGHAVGEGHGRGQLRDRVVDLLLHPELDRAGGGEGQPGPVVVVGVLVAEGEGVRAGVALRHLVEPRDGPHVHVGDLAVPEAGVATGVVGGEGDDPGARDHRVVALHRPEGGPAPRPGRCPSTRGRRRAARCRAGCARSRRRRASCSR